MAVASAGPTRLCRGTALSHLYRPGGRDWACGLSAQCHPWMGDAWRGSLWSGWVQSWVRSAPAGEKLEGQRPTHLTMG